jgi:dTDP-4-amino-4,6-dideoxygalactose transaminase
MADLKQRGIQTSIHYPSPADFTAYRYLDERLFPLAQEISRRELTLPLYPLMGESSVDFVVDSLKAVVSDEEIYGK